MTEAVVVEGANSALVQKAEETVKSDPYDLEAWGVLLAAVKDDARSTVTMLKRVVRVYPTSDFHWQVLISKLNALRQEGSATDEELDSAYSHALEEVPAVPLWMDYIAFKFRKASATAPEMSDSAKRDLYERALAAVGYDSASAPLWDAYLKFLGSLADETRDEQIQLVYKRVLRLPLPNIDDFNNEFEKWKQAAQPKFFVDAAAATASRSVNSIIAESAKNARRVYRRRCGLLEGLDLNRVARPPRSPSTTPEHAARTQQQILQWRALISFDMTNPLRLSPEDHADQMRFMYSKCMVCLYFYPQMSWAAAHFFEVSQPETACTFLQRAAAANPHHLPVHFEYVKCLKSLKRNREAKKALETALELNPESPLVWIRYMQLVRGEASDNAVREARSVFLKARKQQKCTWHIYVAAAQIEQYQNNDNQSATKLYENALRQYEDVLPFVRHYLDFLLHTSGLASVRALYERQLCTMSTENRRQLWDDYVAFERIYGDASTRFRVEHDRAVFLAELKKKDDAGNLPLPPDMEYVEAVNGLSYYDLTACTDDDLLPWGIRTKSVPDVPQPAVPVLPRAESPVQQTVEKQEQPQQQTAPSIPQLPGAPPVQPPPSVPQQQQQQPQPSQQDSTGDCIASLLSTLPPAPRYIGPPVDTMRLLSVIRRLPSASTEPPPTKHPRLS